MAYAPHTNDQVLAQLRAGATPTALPLIVGQFRNAETGVTFEFAERRWSDDDFAPDMSHVVYVGDGSVETRLAKVLKTVAFVVVDEDADGQPVIERWEIKAHRAYDTTWVRA